MYIVKKSNPFTSVIDLNGSKNTAIPILLSSIMCIEDVKLYNLPVELNDIKIAMEIMEEFGISFAFSNDNCVTISHKNMKIQNVPTYGNKIRSSLLFLSILLNLKNYVEIPTPGGCNIGDRKYDIHLDSLREMGAEIEEKEDLFIAQLKNKFNPKSFTFKIATTTGTQNVIIAALFTEGKTIIENANTRPENLEFCRFLNLMGAKITCKTRCIEIEGVNELRGGEFTIMSGRDEALTYMMLAGIHRSEISIKNFNITHIKTDVALLKEIGIEIFEFGNDLYITAKNKKLKPFHMATSPYPGINSDIQPLFAALAATIEGESIITDMRFKSRFQYVDEFRKLNINIRNYRNTCIIEGSKEIRGNIVTATDLRCGAALILLGSIASGETIIQNSYQIDRGYVNIKNQILSLGIDIKEKEDS